MTSEAENHSGEETAFHVLLAEDDDVQLTLTRRAIERANPDVILHHVEDGQKCLNFLRNAGEYGDAPRPHMLLLDLNMPVMDGREVLQEITNDPKLRSLPVVVLTTSTSDDDIAAMYDLRCSSYLSKPVDLHEFRHAIAVMLDYWVNTVALPRK